MNDNKNNKRIWKKIYFIETTIQDFTMAIA